MNWKISDMGMLGVAEGCPLLKTLIAQNCEHLTDVACAWLGKGCRLLHHLDLRNCHKISNGTQPQTRPSGCSTSFLLAAPDLERFLSSPSLRSAGCSLPTRRLTDDTAAAGGIRAIAEGCFDLTFLDLTNLKVLSSCRLIPLPAPGPPSLRGRTSAWVRPACHRFAFLCVAAHGLTIDRPIPSCPTAPPLSPPPPQLPRESPTSACGRWRTTALS